MDSIKKINNNNNRKCIHATEIKRWCSISVSDSRVPNIVFDKPTLSFKTIDHRLGLES